MSDKNVPDFSVVDQKTFVDIPNASPAVKIRLGSVGITNRPIILTLKDPFTETPVTLPSRITVFCSLHATQRGLHMSRIEEAFDELRGAGLSSSEFVTRLGEIILKTQAQEECSISLESDFEHRVSKNVSGKSSVELLRIFSSIEVNKMGETIKNGIAVPFINACPCTQRWGMREFYNTLKGKGYDSKTAEDITRCAPLQAHTNRGTAKVVIADAGATPLALYQMLDRAVPIIRELLKGPDEHSVVSAAHRGGQFCEDNIRSILKEIGAAFENSINPNSLVEVDVEVDESVHFHNLSASFSGTFAELQQLLSVPL